MSNNINEYAEQARQEILDAIHAYNTLYGDFKIAVYKNYNPLHAEIVEIRAGRDAVAIEFEPNDD